MRDFKLPKWAVALVTALLFVPLAVDWVPPGDGARIAEHALREVKVGGEQWMLFPLWSWLVGLVGKDVAALGWISVGAGLVCVWLAAAIFGALFGAAVRGAEEGGAKGEGNYRFVESAAVLLAGLGFAFTPGFLVAATRISPLMVALVPPLAATALVTGVVASRGGNANRAIERLKKGKGRLLLAVGLLGYSAFELVLARRVFLAMAFPALGVWFAAGVVPALVIASCVRKRWLAGLGWIWGAFGGWALAIAAMGAEAVLSGKLDEERAASRIVAQIIANAEGREEGKGKREGGKIAILSDGGLDGLYFFMLPEKIKLISLAREREPEYGRELAAWTRQEVKKLGGGGQQNIEDLVFAAELGPKALVDEWMKLDKTGFEAKVATMATYFPTREKWDEARAMLGNGSERYLRRLMGVTGNALGCALIEQGDLTGAWEVFKAIVDSVEPGNYGAYLNLLGMVQRGFAVPKDEVDDLAKRRQQIEKDLKGWDQILRTVRSSGRIYADPDDLAKYERMKREAAKNELSAEQRAFVETVAAAAKDPKSGRTAREAILKAIREGRVRADLIGGQLLAIVLALGDTETAEKTAIEVLKLNRHDPAANAALGSLAVERGDYERAERYLRRAIATGKASIGAKNDLAWALYRLGRLDEAEPFAREAVGVLGESWACRETLAAILIGKGRIDEGERELDKAEELAEKAGVPKGKVAGIEIDRARILKARGDVHHFKVTMRQLKSRKDLTDEQKAEVRGMDR